MGKKLWLGICLVWLAGGLESCKSPKAAQSPVGDVPLAMPGNGADTLVAPPLAIVADTAPLPYRPERTRRHDLLHTRLEVGFDWAKQHLTGTATLTLKPYFYAQDSLQLDAKGFDIRSVELLEGARNTALPYRYDQKIVSLKLPKPYTRHQQFTVRIKYVAKPNDLPKGGSAAITEDKGLYFINPDGKQPGKPRQIWTQGETEASSCWFPTIDSPNERTTQEIFITVDKQFTTLSNGLLVSSRPNADGTRTDHWRQDKPHAPYLFMMAVGEYAVVRDKWNGLELSYLVEKPYEKHARAIFGRTPEMLSFYSRILDYPYPWDKYAQVVVRDYVSGAMENTGAVVFGESVQKDSRELADENDDDVIAHEMFHHWFGNLVTCESWANLTLNEAFATYGEYLWIEHKHGRAEADYHLQQDQDQYFDEAQSKQEPLIRYYHNDREDMFDAHSYQKGGCVLHMLRKQVGDEAFFKSLNTYLKKHAYNKAEIHDLRLSFEEVTGQDLQWFFDQWFLSPGHPEVKVAHRYAGGKVQLRVQTQNSIPGEVQTYRLPLQVEIWAGGRKTIHEITVAQPDQTFALAAAARPDLVLFDAETQLLGKVSHQKTEAELLYQYYHSDKFLVRYEAFNKLFQVVAEDEAASQQEDTAANTDKNSLPAGQSAVAGQEGIAADAQTPADRLGTPARRKLAADALADPSWVIRQMAVRSLPEMLPAEPFGYEAVVEKMAASDPKSYVRGEAISKMIGWKHKNYQAEFRRALQDSSYYVVSIALFGYLGTQPADAQRQLAAFRNSASNDITLTMAAYYAETAGTEQLDWFLEKSKRGGINFLYPFTQLFGSYLLRQPAETQKKGIGFLESTARNAKNEYVRLNAYQTLAMFDELEGVPALLKDIRDKEASGQLKEMYE